MNDLLTAREVAVAEVEAFEVFVKHGDGGLEPLDPADLKARAAFAQRIYFILWRGPEWATDRLGRPAVPNHNAPVILPGRPSPKPRLKLPLPVRRLPSRAALLGDLQQPLPLSDTRARRLGKKYGLPAKVVAEAWKALAAWQQAVREWELEAQGAGSGRLMGEYTLHEVCVGQVYRLDPSQPPFSVERVLQAAQTLPDHAAFALTEVMGIRWVRTRGGGVWEHRRAPLPSKITARETPSSPLRVLQDYERHARATLLLAEALGIRER
jgi:hypothetical protein